MHKPSKSPLSSDTPSIYLLGSSKPRTVSLTAVADFATDLSVRVCESGLPHNFER